jgi:predicted transglutaminase-like cysteine proteinase
MAKKSLLLLATPKEFLLNSGDCEDYAIIKMLSMKWLGYDTNGTAVSENII